MPLTDQEIEERLSQFEANADNWRHVLKAAGIQEDDPQFGIKRSIEQRALTELQSLRQQLSALRDDWTQLAASSRRHAAKARGEVSEMHAGDAEMYENHAEKIDQILKGTP